ncbi:RagB/SusD family nutrient uptake outer membrane protein [Mucilaginibacter pedocola]|uniref:Uncharacterized protein n=1 Tax=Mucilaginibacter pedocola TaxID=1792845 RepID=A0A1S9PH55_9SPHI|nr:RagB/SusD family nutrient uptake outer membrane protein [Mucilaginibacter pedocola]OOQ60302.1 hypothetical protein BC343_26480 [Mucilaginibacter pedocola]
MKTIKYLTLAVLLLWLMTGCRKEKAFLDAKTDQQLFVPSSLADLANMMHDERAFNMADPALGQVGCDDQYTTKTVLDGLSSNIDRNAYTWAKMVYDPGQDVPDWSLKYTQVYYCNTVLEFLAKMTVQDAQAAQAREIKGDALFFRGKAFYDLLNIFSLPYAPVTAASTPGIPIRLNADINIRSVRSSVKDGYAQAITDLVEAAGLLPVSSAYKTQPSQPAAYGMLARIYLTMGEHQKAYEAADKALSLYSTLTDYSTLRPGTRAISTAYLNEDIFHSVIAVTSLTSINSVAIADTLLYRSYADNDLRKTAFFVIRNNSPYFRGTYDPKRQPYTGLATDELLLTRAECSARLGNTAAAMKDLNTLLATRWKPGTFVDFSASSPEDALMQVLKERRKELLFRGLRWADLRRLNQDARTAVTPARVLNGTRFELMPGDLRYAWPIPDIEITYSGIPQNPR